MTVKKPDPKKAKEISLLQKLHEQKDFLQSLHVSGTFETYDGMNDASKAIKSFDAESVRDYVNAMERFIETCKRNEIDYARANLFITHLLNFKEDENK